MVSPIINIFCSVNYPDCASSLNFVNHRVYQSEIVTTTLGTAMVSYASETHDKVTRNAVQILRDSRYSS